MDIIEHDVVIVGGGAAGLRAAIAAVETSDRLRVALEEASMDWDGRSMGASVQQAGCGG